MQGLGPVNTEEKSFRKGYSECLSEVAKMMMFSPAIDDGTRQKLVSQSHIAITESIISQSSGPLMETWDD